MFSGARSSSTWPPECGAPASLPLLGDVGSAAMRYLPRAQRDDLRWICAPGSALWRAAQQVFIDYARQGANLVVIARIGPYCEVEYQSLFQHHVESNGRVTAVVDAEDRLLDTFVISAARRNDAAFLLRHRLQEFRTPFLRYPVAGYSNRLENASDLRALAVDAFCGRAGIEPAGEQIRPGIWVGTGARIQRGARILAPAFVGERAKVRAAAVITRCGVIEHHAEMGCGTVVEDATLLPYTTVGAGLDVAHSVVGFSKVMHLRRRVAVEISDPKLVGSVLPAPVRALGYAASLLAYLPVNFVKGLLGRNGTGEPALSEAVQTPSAALSETESLPLASGRD
jgi:hypothetical protein